MTSGGWLGVIALLLLVGGGGLAWFRAEGTPPSISGPRELVVGGPGRDVVLELGDEGSGLRTIQVSLTHAKGESPLVDEVLPGNLLSGGTPGGAAKTVELRVDPAALGLTDGDAVLRVTATDWSWRRGLGGNRRELDIPVTVDRKQPGVQIATGLTYVRRGGSGAVAYALSEPTVRDGVTVGGTFYRGYAVPGAPNRRVALYAVPADAPPKPPVRVVAEDAAGNVTEARWPVVVRERPLPEANVTLPNDFLERTVRGLASANGVRTDDLRRAFAEINTDLRAKNERQIREATLHSAETRLWSGEFGQLANSQVTSRFAEHRSYFVGGQINSEATHFGYDLASTAAAPITAANAGRVMYADDLGIYGNCVLVDHGLGLVSLYGHLSRIDVSVGDEVAKGATLGLSGATGLAGGDHLHFAILVGDTYVDPLEWWDRAWVQTHIDHRLGPSGP